MGTDLSGVRIGQGNSLYIEDLTHFILNNTKVAVIIKNIFINNINIAK